MPTNDGDIQVRITASNETAQAIEQTKQKMQEVGSAADKAGAAGSSAFNGITKETTRAMMATKLINSELGIEMPKAITKVLASSSLLGPVMAAAFPIAVIGAAIPVLTQIPELIGQATDAIMGFGKGAQSALEDVKRINAELLDLAKKTRDVQKETALIGLTGPAKDRMELGWAKDTLDKARTKRDALAKQAREAQQYMVRYDPSAGVLVNAAQLEQRERYGTLLNGVKDKDGKWKSEPLGDQLSRAAAEFALAQAEVEKLQKTLGVDLTDASKKAGKESEQSADKAAAAWQRYSEKLFQAEGKTRELVEKEKSQDDRKIDDINAQIDLLNELKQPGVLNSSLNGQISDLLKLRAQIQHEADRAFAAATAAPASQLSSLLSVSPAIPKQGYDPNGIDAFLVDQQAQSKLAQEIMQSAQSSTQKFNVEMAKLDTLLVTGQIGWDGYNKAASELRNRLDGDTIALREFASETGSALKQSLLYSGGWHNALQTIMLDLVQLIAKMTILKQLQQWSNDSGGGGWGGFLNTVIGGIFGGPLGTSAVQGSASSNATWISSGTPNIAPSASDLGISSPFPDWIFGGSHDHSGPAMAGVTYLIGTKEYFTPKVNGYIQPVSDVASAGAGAATPRVRIEMINQGSPMQMEQPQVRWDAKAEEFVVRAVMKNYSNGGDLYHLFPNR